MATRTAYPPSYHHATKTISPKSAQEQLAAFLAKTPSTAYLHPDAILSQTGIQFPAQSGAQGGLALHHLRRIEAGLRGENLIAESKEDLRTLFASEPEPELPAGDDSYLDALIEAKGRSKRARSTERVEEWQDGPTASGPLDLPAGDDSYFDALIDAKGRSRRARSAERVEELQDGLTTDGALDPEEYAHEQTELEEEIGNDTLAGSGIQVNSVPVIKATKMSDHDKAARKAAKKARRKEGMKNLAARKAAD